MVVALFDLLLYAHSTQLRSCWDGNLLNHTVPGQAWMQSAATLESSEEGNIFHERVCWTQESISGPLHTKLARY